MSTNIYRQFTLRKFSHQIKHFCFGSSFLLHDNGVLAPLKLQTFESGFQRSYEPATFFHLRELARGVPVSAVMTLMLMLAQVSAFCSSLYQTNLWLLRVQQQQEVKQQLWRYVKTRLHHRLLACHAYYRAFGCLCKHGHILKTQRKSLSVFSRAAAV